MAVFGRSDRFGVKTKETVYKRFTAQCMKLQHPTRGGCGLRGGGSLLSSTWMELDVTAHSAVQ